MYFLMIKFLFFGSLSHVVMFAQRGQQISEQEMSFSNTSTFSPFQLQVNFAFIAGPELILLRVLNVTG